MTLAASAFTSALWFVAVLALIPLALWLLKRTPLGAGAGAGAPGMLRHVAALPLSPQQRISIVEVGSGEERRWLVLGISAQGIQTLHTMAPQAEPAGGSTAPGASFAAVLGRLRRDTP